MMRLPGGAIFSRMSSCSCILEHNLQKAAPIKNGLSLEKMQSFCNDVQQRCFTAPVTAIEYG